MREMGSLSGVEIEPPQQTKLLDESISLAGVIGGGVPGGKPLRLCLRIRARITITVSDANVRSLSN